MCEVCWAEYGEPMIINDAVKLAAKLITELYDENSVGGNLHIITDDWNIEDEHIEMYRKHDLTPIERACLEALAALSVEERASANAISCGYFNADD